MRIANKSAMFAIFSLLSLVGSFASAANRTLEVPEVSFKVTTQEGKPVSNVSVVEFLSVFVTRYGLCQEGSGPLKLKCHDQQNLLGTQFMTDAEGLVHFPAQSVPLPNHTKALVLRVRTLGIKQTNGGELELMPDMMSMSTDCSYAWQPGTRFNSRIHCTLNISAEDLAKMIDR